MRAASPLCGVSSWSAAGIPRRRGTNCRHPQPPGERRRNNRSLPWLSIPMIFRSSLPINPYNQGFLRPRPRGQALSSTGRAAFVPKVGSKVCRGTDLARILHTHRLRYRKFCCGCVSSHDSSSTGCPPCLRANRTLRLATTKLPAPRDEEYEISWLSQPRLRFPLNPPVSRKDRSWAFSVLVKRKRNLR